MVYINLARHNFSLIWLFELPFYKGDSSATIKRNESMDPSVQGIWQSMESFSDEMEHKTDSHFHGFVDIVNAARFQTKRTPVYITLVSEQCFSSVFKSASKLVLCMFYYLFSFVFIIFIIIIY